MSVDPGYDITDDVVRETEFDKEYKTIWKTIAPTMINGYGEFANTTDDAKEQIRTFRMVYDVKMQDSLYMGLIAEDEEDSCDSCGIILPRHKLYFHTIRGGDRTLVCSGCHERIHEEDAYMDRPEPAISKWASPKKKDEFAKPIETIVGI